MKKPEKFSQEHVNYLLFRKLGDKDWEDYNYLFQAFPNLTRNEAQEIYNYIIEKKLV